MKRKMVCLLSNLSLMLVIFPLTACISTSTSQGSLKYTDWQPDGWRAQSEIFERLPNGTLAVLPFAGGNENDGEAIAELFSFDQIINQVFTPMPRTSITAAMQQERFFQLGSGMTDPDSAVALGREIGARYIIAGNIAQLGENNLLVISILNTETLEQIAGDIQTYRNIEEVADKLPVMARRIARAAKRDSTTLPKLAVVPFTFAGEDAARDVLAQLLAINLLKSGKYAIYPRTASLNQIQQEWKNQLSGDTADENISRIGAGENPRYALSGAARRLGTKTMFNASIIDLESGAQMKGDSADYETLNDGIDVIEFLAAKLSDTVLTVNSTTDFINTVNTINASSWGSYFILLNGDITPSDTIDFLTNAEKTITIIGNSSERTIWNNRSRFPLITVKQGITLILGNNLTLRGAASNSNLVWVTGGSLELRDGATLKYAHDSAIVINDGGILFIKGGTIYSNQAEEGGGIFVSRGTINMTGGNIIENKAVVSKESKYRGNGGGIYVASGSTFHMSGGTIAGNIAERKGGGVFVFNDDTTTFIKTGGTIDGTNSAPEGKTVGTLLRSRNSGVGPLDRLDSRIQGESGGWILD